MQEKLLQERIERAKELLGTVLHVPLATVNEDGSPHNSPVFVTFDKAVRTYWASNVDSLHSQNIRQDGRIFLVLFDSMGRGGGLYIEASAHEVTDEEELAAAVSIVNKRRRELLRAEVAADDFLGRSTQRLYCAWPVKLWVNVSRHDRDGRVLSDKRIQVSKEMLFDKMA